MKRLKVHITSFGYKYGNIPENADIIINCRVMNNPAKLPDLWSLNGFDERVRKNVMRTPQFQDIIDLATTALSKALKQHRKNFRIAFGCLGGKHRSVVVAEHLAEHIRQHPLYAEPVVVHQEQDKWPVKV